MKMGAGALLASGVWPGALAAQDVDAPDFSFICVNDLHYVDHDCLPFFHKMAMKMRIVPGDSRLLLVVGDLCDNGTLVQHAGIREVLRTTNMITRVVIGNHDWSNQIDRKAYEQTWPDSINYSFEFGRWQFVGLDSSEGVKYESTLISQSTLEWVDQNLPKIDKKRPLIIFTHFPMGQGVKYQPINADELLNRFKDHNLRAVFDGHFHGYTERTRGECLITTNKCCSFRIKNHDGTPEKGFFLCRARDGKVDREFIEVDRQQA